MGKRDPEEQPEALASEAPERRSTETPDSDCQPKGAIQHLSIQQRRWLSLVTLMLAASAISAILYWLRGAPHLNALPGWFYRTHKAFSVGPALAVLVAGCAPAIVRWSRGQAQRGRHARALGALIVLGGLTQVSLHFIVPPGLEQMFERLTVGHGEFLRVAAARRGMLLETVTRYDDLFQSGQLGVFAGSKPPGTLTCYMILDRVAQADVVRQVLAPLIDQARASGFVRDVPESAALATVLFPLLTFLGLVPLVWLSRSLFDDLESGYDAALLAYSTPALLLIDLHLDGALFPLLGTAAVALAAHSIRTRRHAPAVAGGAVAMFGTYCSFALLTCLGIGVGIALLAWLERRTRKVANAELLAPLKAAGAFLGGATLMLAFLMLVLRFDPVRRFNDALTFHIAWKAAVPTDLWRGLSLLEFGLYVGVPLSLTFVGVVLASPALLRAREHLVTAGFALGMGATLGVMAWRQGTNEVARLWLFLVPFMALAVAVNARAWFGGDVQRRLLTFLVVAQVVLGLVMKVRQPW